MTERCLQLNKHSYATREECEGVRKALHPIGTKTYRCTFCNGWHFGKVATWGGKRLKRGCW